MVRSLDARPIGDQQDTATRSGRRRLAASRHRLPRARVFAAKSASRRVRLALATISPARPLYLHHAHPDGLKMRGTSQRRSCPCPRSQPPSHRPIRASQQHQLTVTRDGRRDRDLTQQLPQPVQRHRNVLDACGCPPQLRSCRSPPRSSLRDEDAAGQSCVERCQASMKSRRHPCTAGGGRQIGIRARLGQLNHESSRRQPHPLQRAGHHRPTTHATQLNHADPGGQSGGGGIRTPRTSIHPLPVSRFGAGLTDQFWAMGSRVRRRLCGVGGYLERWRRRSTTAHKGRRVASEESRSPPD